MKTPAQPGRAPVWAGCPALTSAPARSRRVFLAALLFFATTPFSQAATNETAFVDVNLIPMTSDRVVPHQTVLVRDDRIVRVGPKDQVVVPDTALRVDGAGRFLIPGLGEMHGHNPPLGSSEEFVETVYFLFVANGVTTVRGMLGWPGQLELREKVKHGELLGPTLYLAGPSFSGSSIHSPAQAEQRVREQKSEGWDLLKIHPGLKREHYDALARTADAVGIRFAGHVPVDVGIVHALKSGQETIDHLDGYIDYLGGDKGPLDAARLNEVRKITRDSGAWVVPTLVLWETIIGAADPETMSGYGELKFMPPSQVEQWESSYRRLIGNPNFDKARADRIAANRKVLLKALNDGGVKILFGTDAPQQFSVPGFSIHREMKAMAAAGLKPYEILVSATRNVGEYFKAKDLFGTIETGRRADLVLLEGNPLEDIGNVARRAGVMVRGQWLPEKEIQNRLGRIAQQSGR